MKIGILAENFNDLSNWQLRVIQSLINDADLELKLLIYDDKNQNPYQKHSFKTLFSKLRPSRLLLVFQIYIEKKVFFKEEYSVCRVDIKQALKKLPEIGLSQKDKVDSDLGRSGIFEQVRRQNLDVIINLSAPDFQSELFKLAKYGIWDIVHADVPSMSLGAIGFLEVLQKKPSIGFKLLQRKNNTHVEILDSAFFNRGWSMVETATIAQEGGVSVLLKNLRKLQKGHVFNSNAHTFPVYQYPRFYDVLKYVVQFNKHLYGKIIQKIAYRFWGRRHECWSIFIGRGSFIESQRSFLKPLQMPKDEFWADPFLFKHQDKDYVFFENYSYKTNRGKISCGLVEDEKLTDIIDILDLDYHLSFPFIFEENGSIFLMPETSENKRLELYRAVEFPTKWELFTTAFEGEMVADAFFFDDENNQKWLFVNKQAAETSPMNSELFIYKTDSLKLDNLQPHVQNPVLIDARVARNGGAIFMHENKLYRPSQRNTDGIYGRALNMNQIKKLTLNEYEEENIRTFEADFDENLMATHHLHQTEELYVFDAAYRSK